MKKVCRKEQFIRLICDRVSRVVKADPKAAKMEVLQRLGCQMNSALVNQEFRDAEEVAFQILLSIKQSEANMKEAG